jgi:hypothetical protein
MPYPTNADLPPSFARICLNTRRTFIGRPSTTPLRPMPAKLGKRRQRIGLHGRQSNMPTSRSGTQSIQTETIALWKPIRIALAVPTVGALGPLP